MAEHEEKVYEQQRKRELGEQIWLNYFNQTLYEQGLITETERNRMKNKINSRRPSRALR